MNIRRAVDEDADVISLLNAEIQAQHAAALPWRFKPPGPETFPPEAVRALLGLPENHFFLAEPERAAVGYVYAEVVRRSETNITYAYDLIYVHHLYVRPDFRGLGIARTLLDVVRKVGGDLGIARLSLDVWTFNEDARAFFRRYGLMPYNERLWHG